MGQFLFGAQSFGIECLMSPYVPPLLGCARISCARRSPNYVIAASNFLQKFRTVVSGHTEYREHKGEDKVNY